MSFPVLGAPGIYRLPDEPLRALTGVRMDVCAFLGVAPRGPARAPVFRAPWADAPCGAHSVNTPTHVQSIPVAVESWDAYRRSFGAFEGPGLLPYAVASFFENGGRRAYIVRIVHTYGDARDDLGVAQGDVSGIRDADGKLLRLRARNEGSWGNGMRAGVSYRTAPLAFEEATAAELRLAPDIDVPVGTLLRLTLPGGVRLLRFVTSIINEWRNETGRRVRRALLETPLVAVPGRAEIVEAELSLDDGAGREELHAALGLAPEHPRWIAAVLHRESELVYPLAAWSDDALTIEDPLMPAAPAPQSGQFADGLDRYADITPADFFDDDWVLGDECPGRGVHSLVDLSDLSLVTAPDLYSPGPLAPIESVADARSMAGPTFERCVSIAPATPSTGASVELEGLRLDPELPADLDEIVGWQNRLIDLAESLRSFIVLLDVPPRLNHNRVLAWRARFGSSYAAAYHPWLIVTRRDDQRDALVRINPAAVAAGVIARREHSFGVPHGPANELAAGVINVADVVSSERHDVLHQANVNVYLRERDGIRLTAARTLARTPDYRQLNVRRLIMMIVRAVEQQMQWTVFEPNNESLRSDVRQLLRGFLRQLFRANAFRGATEAESFFVRCDSALNTPSVVDAGRLIAEVGVAPAEPMEFLVLHLTREGDGTLRLEA